MAPTVREAADKFEVDQMLFGTRGADSTAVMMYNDIVVKLQKKLSIKKRDVMVSGDPFAPVRKYLTRYSIDTAQEQFKNWCNLEVLLLVKYIDGNVKANWCNLEVLLLVKYIDGNVKAQNKDGSFKHSEYSEGIPDKLTQPGYTDIWKAAVASEHGETVKVLE